MMLKKLVLAITAASLSATAIADKGGFSDFTPLIGDVGESTLPEAAPYRLSSPDFGQISIVARDTMQTERFDSGNYDMHTANESGPDAGRYLFTVFETSQPGIQRTDLRSMLTTTIWAAPAVGSHRSFDASRWTPWGSFLTAEESWSDPGAATSPYGRLFEVTNPLASPEDINIVHRDILPRVSHEGLAFDKQNNLYFIDERNNSHIFKYTSRKPKAQSGDEYFAAGQTFVLRVGDGTVEEATGAFTWIPLTDRNGQALPGVVIVTDPNGLTAIDGRATPNLPAFLGTDFDRPEDMEIKSVGKGKELLFIATTTNNKVFALDLKRQVAKLYVSRDTIDRGTGLPASDAFTSPDNIAIDNDGNIYVVEDQPGGIEDVWFTYDRNNDGVAESMAKWASLSTAGAESTGLYFDKFQSNIAYINVQHPNSGVDRTIMLTTPCECCGDNKGRDHKGRDHKDDNDDHDRDDRRK